MATWSDVRELESKVSEIRAENRRMENEIAMMGDSLNRALSKVTSAKDNALGALSNGTNTLTSDDKTLMTVAVVEEDIRGRMVLYKNIENAYKTIRRLNNDLRYHQGNEKTVRRMLTAMVDNDERAFASDETIREQSEKMYLQTQYYFLSHVMMDLQLRKAGESAAADRARAEALKMDARKSAWVYFMIALRNEKPESQTYWLSRIMEQPLTGSEKEQLKILTLLSLKDDAPDSGRIREYIGLDKIGDIDKEEIVAKILSQYQAAMVVRPPEFRNISKYVAESDKLKTALRGAMNNEEVGIFVQKLRNGGDEKAYHDVITAMFDSVIETCHSPKAQEIYDEIAYQEKIIEAKGHLEEAMAKKAQEDVEKVSDIDLEDCLFKWLNERENYVGKREITKFSYEKFKPSYKHAYRNYVRSYRSGYRESVNVKIDEYSTKTDFSDIEAENAKAKEFCRSECVKEKAAVKDTKFILFTVFGAVLLVAGIVLNYALSIGVLGNVLAVAAMLAGVVLLAMGAITKFKNYRKRIEIDKKWEQNAISYVEKLQYVYKDILSYRELYKGYDATTLPDSIFE